MLPNILALIFSNEPSHRFQRCTIFTIIETITGADLFGWAGEQLVFGIDGAAVGQAALLSPFIVLVCKGRIVPVLHKLTDRTIRVTRTNGLRYIL